MSLSVGPYSPTQSFYQNVPLQHVMSPVQSKVGGTVTGSSGFGSSLFLHRVGLSGVMNLSEIDIAVAIGFNASNNGQGSLSRSFGLYSFVNSTSLQSILSFSGTSSWTTGTSTVLGSTSLSQFQAAWGLQSTAGIRVIIWPLVFASSLVTPGEYVVGQIMNLDQASSSWSVSLYGAAGISTTSMFASSIGTTAANITAFSAGPTAANAMSSSGLIAASAITASTAVNVLSSGGLLVGSHFTATTEVSALSSTGLAAASGINGALGVARYGSQFLALSTAGSMTSFQLSATVTTTKSSQTVSGSAFVVTLTNTAVQSCSWGIGGVSSNNSIVSNVTLGTLAGSILTASGSAAVLSNGGLLAGSFLTSSSSGAVFSAGGLLVGSFLTASNSAAVISNAGTSGYAAITAAAMGVSGTTILAATRNNDFSFVGTGPTIGELPNIFEVGVMSTGALPATIDLTTTAVTWTRQTAYGQPWFRLIGA